MKRFSEILLAIVGVAIIVVAAWGAFLGIRWVFQQVGTAQSETLKVIVPTSATVLVGFLGVLVQKYAEKRKEVEMKLREEKVKVYDALMILMFDLMKQSKAQKRHDGARTKEKDFENHFIETTRQLIMWSSDGVLNKYSEFRASAEGGQGSTPARLLGSLGELLLEIRKDLGHKNKGVSSQELLKFFINDVDRFLGAPQEAGADQK